MWGWPRQQFWRRWSCVLRQNETRADLGGTLLAWLAGTLSGCALLLVGAGAAGGYAISRDAIQNDFNLPASHVYRVSLDTVDAIELVTAEHEAQGLINATIQEAKVTITVARISERTTQLKVRAGSRCLFPKIEVAQRGL